ncbi:malonic semialdehyde reductase [Pseudomonas sp. MYb185]|uniref:malonic semialdehyde reductase n=1 Tax=Pseudomonas sp. MYb185 TaxID=1848729 RepID=UPI000CFB2323|nr:malonic semialdehyde reductase [Pseudomonas sp. MYb185]PRB80025.1 malonic semialdehyde reductase [Pseudomonas sp. MYb185]
MTLQNDAIDWRSIEQLFINARSAHDFTDEPVTDTVLHQLYEYAKLGPTGFNTQPGRYLFVRTEEVRQKLAARCSSSNTQKVLSAPVTLIVAYDSHFHQFLPTQFPAFDAKGFFEKTPALIEPTALTNATLQAAYMIFAARALGLTAGPMSGFDNERVDTLFFPDGRWKSLLLINLGYADASRLAPRGPRLEFAEVAQIL